MGLHFTLAAEQSRLLKPIKILATGLKILPAGLKQHSSKGTEIVRTMPEKLKVGAEFLFNTI